MKQNSTNRPTVQLNNVFIATPPKVEQLDRGVRVPHGSIFRLPGLAGSPAGRLKHEWSVSDRTAIVADRLRSGNETLPNGKLSTEPNGRR